MAKCEEKLIADHREVLIGDFQNLLDFDKDEGECHITFANYIEGYSWL